MNENSIPYSQIIQNLHTKTPKLPNTHLLPPSTIHLARNNPHITTTPTNSTPPVAIPESPPPEPTFPFRAKSSPPPSHSAE